MFDLRLLGSSKSLSVKNLSRHLLPWSQRGLWLIIPSGILLFITNAKTLGTDLIFWIKMGLLVLAVLNVLIFHKIIFKPYIKVSENGRLPYYAKVSALVSMMLWIAIIACGRLLAY